MATQVSLLDGALASAGTLAIQTNGTTSAITISSAQVATFVNNPIMTGLTASRAVFTDGSKGLTSNAITGTGNVVMSASPTLTGTIDGAALTLSSSLTLSAGTANGVLYLNGSKVATSGSVLTFDGAQLGVNGITVGRGAGAVSSNTAVGASAFNSASNSGGYGVAVGYQALYYNTTGSRNTAAGYQAAYANTTGSSITAFGDESLYSNTTGGYNTAVGGPDSGTWPVLYSNTTGSYNTAVGSGSLAKNTTASNNNAVGYQSLYSNTTGTENNALGKVSLYSNTTGNYNVAIGQAALYANTTASNNTALGYQALYANTTGANNIAVGFNAGYVNTTGYSNTFLGRTAGESNTTGYQNTFIGNNSGNAISTGNSNTILGRYTGNQGGLDIRTASNYIVLSDGDGNVEFTAKDGSSWALPGATVQTGTGITFPATQSASSNANTLDDYEEGTGTVNLSPATSGTITIDTANDTVAYTKIGRQVTITGQVVVSSVSSPVGGYVHVNNLPFASADLSEISGRIGGAVTYYDGTAGTYTAKGVLMLEGGTQARLYVDASTVSAGSAFIFSFSYFTT